MTDRGSVPQFKGSTVRSIDIVGCGKVGRTLGRLWTERDVLEVRSVLNRSPERGAEAAEFVGAGRAVTSYDQLDRADLMMLSTPDEAIGACCDDLCRAGAVEPGMILFHTSGSVPSSVLEPARALGAAVAGVHPVRSFADPVAAAESFTGTYCAIEGDAEACRALGEVFEPLGAKLFEVDPAQKAIYHAATVVVCNYLVALMEVGLRCFDRSGVPRETAREIIEPIVRGTVENVFRLGPAAALSGPIARGEASVVAGQREALAQWDEQVRRVYDALGHVAADLAAAAGRADPAALEEIRRVLDT